MVSPDQPELTPSVPPCKPDDAVDHLYDSRQFGTCANGHPLNRAGRCPVTNGVATHAELVAAALRDAAEPL